MNTQNQLLPCPFCGGSVRPPKEIPVGHDGSAFRIYCHCGCIYDGGHSAETAVRNWNRRFSTEVNYAHDGGNTQIGWFGRSIRSYRAGGDAGGGMFYLDQNDGAYKGSVLVPAVGLHDFPSCNCGACPGGCVAAAKDSCQSGDVKFGGLKMTGYVTDESAILAACRDAVLTGTGVYWVGETPQTIEIKKVDKDLMFFDPAAAVWGAPPTTVDLASADADGFRSGRLSIGLKIKDSHPHYQKIGGRHVVSLDFQNRAEALDAYNDLYAAAEEAKNS